MRVSLFCTLTINEKSRSGWKISALIVNPSISGQLSFASE